MTFEPITILTLGGLIALVLLIVGIFVSVTSERKTVEARMGRYIDEKQEILSDQEKTAPLTDWLNTRV